MAFTSLKYIFDLRLLVEKIQNFQIDKEFYYIQRYINAKLYNNNLSHNTQLYLYDSTFIMKQHIVRNYP